MAWGTRNSLIVSACAAALALGGCGGGGGSGPEPTPPPPPPPPQSPFDTAEYQASNSAVTAKALAAYDAGASGAGVKVAVIDTGINPTLPEFTGRIDPASQDVAADRGLVDHDGHGTMVSGVIAANKDNVYTHGVAYQATILSLNVGDPAGCKPGQDCFLDEAIDDAIDLARIHGAKIINMSFGDEEGMTADVWPAIQRAVDAGLIIIMSAGNGGTANPNGFALQNIADNGGSGLFIIAGAMNANRTIASFSDRAGTTEAANHYLTALGVGNATVDEFGNQVNVNGTSFSAPTIAGAAALLAGAFPNLSGADIVELLLGTADDAGAAGTDSTFGRGILNIERAFQPQGATTLAGSSMAVSMSDNGTLSGAMGDASPRSGGAIILDGYSRAYVLDLAKTLRRTPREQPLRQGLDGGSYQTAGASAGPLSVAVTIRHNAVGESGVMVERMRLGESQGRTARAIAATAISRLTPRTAVALGFSQGGRALQRQLAGVADNAFLVARDPLARAGFHADAGTSAGLRHDFGPAALSITSERGRVADPGPVQRPDRSRYSLDSVTLDRRFGRARLSLGASRLKEEDRVLGGQFSELLASGGATTTFLDASAHFDLGAGWDASASYRHGWTAIRGAGQIAGNGRFASQAFAFDLAKHGAFIADDKLALRMSQPLRVVSGGLALTLPATYDYKTGAVGYESRFFGLSPSGREMNFEAAYGRSLFGGSIDLNAFLRTDPGHIESMRRDVGAAVRFSKGL